MRGVCETEREKRRSLLFSVPATREICEAKKRSKSLALKLARLRLSGMAVGRPSAAIELGKVGPVS